MRSASTPSIAAIESTSYTPTRSTSASRPSARARLVRSTFSPRRASKEDCSNERFDDDDDDASPFTIAVYTKPGCCLCDGLKEKIECALESARRGEASARTGTARDALRDFILVSKDVSENELWAELYAGSVPRVFIRDSHALDGEEWVEFARPPPKTSAARVCDDLDAFVRSRRPRSGVSSSGWVVNAAPAWDTSNYSSHF